MSGEAPSLDAALLRGVLCIASWGYAAAVCTRNTLFNSGIRQPKRLPRPVICIGNLTTGGTGKTPIVAWLASELRARGHSPAILLRGYHTDASGRSDEAQWYESRLNRPSDRAIPILVGANRHQSGSAGLAQHPQISHFVLDDGFQHRQLHRDLDVVLIDATNPFGFGRLLPRGLLREPLSGLRRARFIIVTRCEQVNSEQIEQIKRQIKRHNPDARLVHASARLSGMRMPDSSIQPIESLRGMRIFAFCGIGNPRSFERLLHDAGAVVAGTRWFSDHQHYSEKMLSDLESTARACGAQWLVTTEKDGVKLGGPSSMPIVQATMQINLDEPNVLIQAGLNAGDQL